MALSTETKLYVALGVLAMLGGAVVLQNKKQAEEAATYSLDRRSTELPKIALTDEDLKQIDKITINKPGEDGGVPTAVELTKSGEDWKLSKPLEANANQANVKSLLDNLKTLKVAEVIDTGATGYTKYEVTDEKALHAVFYKGSTSALDVYFGQNGGRGQMTRIVGKDGVYAVKGYSNYLYNREPKAWRDLTIFKFEEPDIASVSIENDNGAFAFNKEGEKWAGKFKKKGEAALQPIKNFEESKVADLLRAYKNLAADNYAEKDKTEAATGLDKPKGKLTFTLKDGGKREILLGQTAEGSNKWVKASTSPEILSVSSWVADWITAELKRFQKEEKKD